jgi:predicted nucleic acid binding AN1-type Zn finger protein
MNQEEPKVCDVCAKKISLCVIQCRCNGNFCKRHVAPENHMCKFDYKLLGQEIIRKNNPKIIPSKV